MYIKWNLIRKIQKFFIFRTSDCQINYCNIEGVQLLGKSNIIAVSDKMKGKGKQDSRCLLKDQSIHLFSFISS